MSPATEEMPRIEWPADDGPAPYGNGAELVPGYRVISHLRRGNHLDVYDAWSDKRHSRCVLKVPRPDRMDDADVLGRLAEEGRLLLSMSHPHIVRAYSQAGPPDPVLVLETLAGETLSRLIEDAVERQERTSGTDLAILGLQLCSAVAYLHGRGVLHLDLKPSNVIVEAGRAKLLDLSLARPPGPAPAGVGTWGYLAPEQARGSVLGPPADVWGIGATLYEAATGRGPFDEPGDDGEDYPQLVRSARPIDTGRTLSPGLVGVVAACLAPTPEARPDIHDLIAALEQESGLPASEVRPRG